MNNAQREQQLALPPEQRDVVCVLGGRSGTSLVARQLNLLGVYLGAEENLMPANEANERGFWEHEKIVDINDAILARYDRAWPNNISLPDGWLDDGKVEDLREAALALVREEFANAPLWGWKDPRACVTMPFWRQVMPNMQFVLSFRNPVDTARSNAKTLTLMVKEENREWAEQHADQVYATGVENWLYFMRLMLDHTLGRPRMALLYEDVMDDLDLELRRIARFVGLDQAARDPKVLQAVREFRSDKLRHHNTTLEEVLAETRLPLVARSVFLSLRARVSLERESQRAVERGELDRHVEEALPLELLATIVAEGMQPFKQHEKPEPDLDPAVEAERKRHEHEQAQQRLAEHVRKIVVQHTPSDAQVVVVSHGDDRLVQLNGRSGGHFPQTPEGAYTGYHPADSASAIENLIACRQKGATFLLVPQPQFWWLDHYRELRDHLDGKHRCVTSDEHCILYELSTEE